MKFRFLLLAVTVASLARGASAAEPAEKPDWPSGVNPATLLPNQDPEPDLAQPGFVDLFNGTDLTGWTVKGGPMKFEAREGAIIGTCDPAQRANGFLCTDKTYRDFIFTTDFKWDVAGNSGVMFRSDTRPLDNQDFDRVFGYQSEMDQNERRWSGGIYGEAMGGWKYPLSKPEGHAAARAAIQDHFAWNRMTIQARGDVIKTWINGVPCSHLVNGERDQGFFGLQIHSGGKGTVRWRNVRIKEFPAPGPN